MFVITQSETYSWPVEVKVPIDNGRFETQKFDAVFKRVSQSRLQEITKQSDTDSPVSDIDFAREVLRGWKGITDANGEDVPYSETMRDELLNIPRVAYSIVIAFNESLSGAKRKN